MKTLEDIRKKYDYLHDMIEGHITLVFPFESDLSTDDLVKSIKPIMEKSKKFMISCRSISKVEAHGYFLFLDVSKGEDSIMKLHDELYQGILAEYQPEWAKNGGYRAHMTLGRFKDERSLDIAYEDVKGFNETMEILIDRVYIEIIEEDESSTIEAVIHM